MLASLTLSKSLLNCIIPPENLENICSYSEAGKTYLIHTKKAGKKYWYLNFQLAF